MIRDRTNLYVAYRKTFPKHLKKKVTTEQRFNKLRQEEEGLLGSNDEYNDGIELDEFVSGSNDNSTSLNININKYTDLIQDIENQGNGLTKHIKENMKQLRKKYREVLLPQFDDDLIQSEMKIVNDISNRITDEIRMIYNVINELQKLDKTLEEMEYENNEFNNGSFKDINNGETFKGTRILVSNLKKKFATVAQSLSGEFREMQGKYIKYLKKDDDILDSNSSGKFKDNFDSLVDDSKDIESYSRTAMLESSKQIELQSSQMQNQGQGQGQSQIQINREENSLVDDQLYLLEREREIYKISQNVVEISMIFKELENIVIDQGTILDNIEYNLSRTTENVQGAHKQLNKAEGYQRQTRKCKIVLFLVLLIFLLLMILMVKPRHVDHYIHDGTKSDTNKSSGEKTPVGSDNSESSSDNVENIGVDNTIIEEHPVDEPNNVLL